MGKNTSDVAVTIDSDPESIETLTLSFVVSRRLILSLQNLVLTGTFVCWQAIHSLCLSTNNF
jgi:hypothetical protein